MSSALVTGALGALVGLRTGRRTVGDGTEAGKVLHPYRDMRRPAHLLLLEADHARRVLRAGLSWYRMHHPDLEPFDPPVVSWIVRHSERGSTGMYGNDHRILVYAGDDPTDQIVTVLHELAHAIDAIENGQAWPDSHRNSWRRICRSLLRWAHLPTDDLDDAPHQAAEAVAAKGGGER